MKIATALFVTAILGTSPAPLLAEDIILRLRPEASAPILTRMVASEKVLLDAAPAGSDANWKVLELDIPFEGFVPESALTKNFAIIEDTPVHYLPEADADVITRARDGDLYEIKRVKDGWATVRYNKTLKTYFRSDANASPQPLSTAAPELLPAEPKVAPRLPEPVHTPAPQTRGFDPNLGVGTTALSDLPPENVIWSSTSRQPQMPPEPEPLQPLEEPMPIIEQPPNQPIPEREPRPIVVSPEDTQAREAQTRTPPEADQPHRVLTGILVRDLGAPQRSYPIRLNAPDGRMIAYVDLSGIFIEDLSLFLNQRVMLRGQIVRADPNSRDLVIFVHQILPTSGSL